MWAAAPRLPTSSWLRCRHSQRSRHPPLLAHPQRTGYHGDGEAGLTLPGLCSGTGCSLEQLVASTPIEQPSIVQQAQLARRLAERSHDPLAQVLAAATLQQQPESSGNNSSGNADLQAAGINAARLYGRGAAQGDPWCLLKLAQLCSEQAADAISLPRRRRLYDTSRLLLQQAAEVVHGAAGQWDMWLKGGGNAALGSFVALCSSGSSRADVAAQVEQVCALVADAVAEEGAGLELWCLHDLLQRQQQRLQLG